MSIRKKLTLILASFVILQVVIGSMGFIALRNTHEEIQKLNIISLKEKTAVDNAFQSLIFARTDMNRFALRMYKEGKPNAEMLAKFQSDMDEGDRQLKLFMDIPKITAQGHESEVRISANYQAFKNVLVQMLGELKENNMEAYFSHPTDQLQSKLFADKEGFEKFSIDFANTNLAKIQSRYELMEYVNIGVFIFLLAISVITQVGIKKIVLNPLKDVENHFRDIATGDLTHNITVQSRDEIGQVFLALQQMQTSLIKMVSSVQNATHNIYVGTEEIATGNADLSQRTEEQAASLQETTSNMNVLTGAVRQNAENANQANRLAENAQGLGQKGSEAVQGALGKMQAIAQSSVKIGEITSIIESIAFQTNILALNAAVEAARAGEEGRGFAVVASEVRNLAQKTAQASKEIKELINKATTQAREGEKAVDDTSENMQQVQAAIRQVCDLMNEINASSIEQSKGITQVNQSVMKMDTVTQQNAALVEEAAAAATSLHEQTEQLKNSIEMFHVPAQNEKNFLTPVTDPSLVALCRVCSQ